MSVVGLTKFKTEENFPEKFLVKKTLGNNKSHFDKNIVAKKIIFHNFTCFRFQLFQQSAFNLHVFLLMSKNCELND